MTSPWRERLLLASLPFLAALLAHASALGGWWLSDDPQVLIHAWRHSPLQILTDESAYRYLSSSSFTPLVTVSFDVDLTAAGLEPRFFYVHQLLGLATGAALFSLVLRRWIPLFSATAAGVAVAVGPLFALAARTLMIRHYVEGLCLALVAILLWRDRRAALWLSALTYLLAMLCKEFYAPLPLVLIAIDLAESRALRTTAARLLPHSIAAAVYLLWRTSMLGSGGGSGQGIGGLTALPTALWTGVTGELPRFVSLILVVLFAAALVALLRRARALLSGAAILFFLLLPLAAVASSFDERYAFVTSLVVIAVIALGSARLGPRAAAGVMVVVVISLAVAGQRRASRHHREVAMMVAEGRYVWSAGAKATPLVAGSPGWYLTGLDELRSQVKKESSPPFFLSPYAIQVGGTEAATFVEATPLGTVRGLSGEVVSQLKHRRTLQSRLPLDVRFERHDDAVSWQLSPPSGRYVFLSLPHYDDYEIGPSGFLRLPRADGPQSFRIYRELSDGRWAATPPLSLPARDGTAEWRQ